MKLAVSAKPKPYPEYKDSGIEWLDEIPNHWVVKRLKFTSPASTKKLNAKPADAVYLGLENIQPRTGRLMLDAPVEEVDSHVGVFSKDDVLFGKLRPYLAKVTCATFDGVCTTELLVLKAHNRINARFLCYRLLSDDFIGLVNSFTYGTKMPRASAEQIGNIALALPLLSEQGLIANYLDLKTEKIDALIGKKKRLIELLQEKRAALISHAVTKGLDPNAPMKDSGVEWLGEIPKHWTCVRLKHICSLLRDGTHIPPPRITAGKPLLSVRNLIDGKLITLPDDSMISEEDFRELQRSFQVKENDVLLAIVGATLGKVAIVPKLPLFQIQRSIALFRPKPSNVAFTFLAYFLRGQLFQSCLWSNVGFLLNPVFILVLLETLRLHFLLWMNRNS